ncbi:hypothetical protein INS49_010006 [Diaporthe citri]|uniref:uncharacterized protein n=1 Tax=Diaporthe citri TaxID=83186 RepID=UPI001C80894A|nr:uncharacterized protein INS49_010006 [Diaporthe citri]KAG6361777.1 hypothetical protein INS49_010006 [Diaporthe citri]
MVSRITPPSSSPTQPDRVQPYAAGPFDCQQNDWPGSSAPPPKRRRKDSPVAGEPEVIGLLSSDDLTPGLANRQPSQPQHSEPAPVLQQNAGPHARPSPVKQRPSGPPRSKPRASNPAKALAKAAANGQTEAAPPAGPQAPEVVCEPPPTTSHHGPQSGWAVAPSAPHPPDRQQSWQPPLPGIVPPPPFQPVWNTPAPPVYPQEDPWTNPSNVDLYPMNPFFQHWYPGGQPFLQPQEQPWSRQPRYAYDMPAQTNTFVSYTSPVYPMPVDGTAERPILLDDEPIQAFHVP